MIELRILPAKPRIGRRNKDRETNDLQIERGESNLHCFGIEIGGVACSGMERQKKLGVKKVGREAEREDVEIEGREELMAR